MIILIYNIHLHFIFYYSENQHLTVKVRLAGTRFLSNYGRVEVNYNGTWGTVCDDGWDKRDADVVCRMLGYSHALEARSSATFGSGSGWILLTDVDCKGNETSLQNCSHSRWGITRNCYHNEDAGVICARSGEMAKPVQILYELISPVYFL